MDSDDFLGLVGTLLVAALIFAGLIWLKASQCEAKWERSGIQSEYGIIQGCVINVKGRWIPEERYRDVNE